MSEKTAKTTKPVKQISIRIDPEAYDGFVTVMIADGHRKVGEWIKSLINKAAAEQGSDYKLPVSR